MINSTNQKTVIFERLPLTAAELKSMPQAALTDPFDTAALTVAALCRYPDSPDDCIAMLNYLRGPRPLSVFETQFLRDRLMGKPYKPRSYLAGTSPQNNYTPQTPYSVTVYENIYSRPQENYLTLWLESSGADSPRQVQLRCKPSTGQWFLWDQMLLADIRIPVEEDPWA